MRKSVLGIATAAAIALAGTGALIAYAQPAPPGPGAGGPAMQAPSPPPGPGWMRWHRMEGAQREGMMHRRWERMRTFSLFYRPDDRKLTAGDVQTIAQALLLWNGNHTWKVTNVTPTSDGQVSFAYAAPDGTVIAQFQMDTKTGRLTRTG
jgi:hypothetical protein